MSTEWFRRSTWTRADQDEFTARLRRSRPHSRSQYIRIQAAHLAEARLYPDALTLLDRVIAEYPDQLQLAQAHKQRGECLLALGDLNSALEAFRTAIEAQRAFPNVQTTAPLHFGFTVARFQRRDLYGEALSVLDEFAPAASSAAFPYQEFLNTAARALMAHDRSDPEARDMAERALRAVSARHSGFPRHPTVGLVGHVDRQTLDRLRAAAS